MNDTAPTEYTFSRAAWRALLGHACKEAARPNLHGIALYEDGTACATDGHRLIMRRPALARAATADRGQPSLVVAYDAALSASKLMRKKTDEVVIRCESDGITLSVGDAQIAAPYLDASIQFPPVHRVTSAGKGSPTFFGVNSAMLADTLKLMSALVTDSKVSGVRIATRGSLDPIHIIASGDDGADWLAVVMPCRI